LIFKDLRYMTIIFTFGGKMFAKIYCGLSCIGECFQSLLLLVIRLYWGFGFFQAGYAKLSGPESVSHFFGELGIPFPTLSTYLAGTAELVGGALLIVGLFSRLAAIPLIIVMIVAYFTAHHAAIVNIWSDPAQFIAQQAFTFLLAALLVFAFGPGKISLDYLICKFFFQKKCSADNKECK
jgi:putative oxidoreductase